MNKGSSNAWDTLVLIRALTETQTTNINKWYIAYSARDEMYKQKNPALFAAWTEYQRRIYEEKFNKRTKGLRSISASYK